MKNKTLSLVNQICNNSNFEINCRGLNNIQLATELLQLHGIKFDKIIEIPLSWSNQVVIIFIENNIEHEFFAGIAKTGEFMVALDENIINVNSENTEIIKHVSLNIKNDYFTFNNIIAGGINNNIATITNNNLSFQSVIDCKNFLENMGYIVEVCL